MRRPDKKATKEANEKLTSEQITFHSLGNRKFAACGGVTKTTAHADESLCDARAFSTDRRSRWPHPQLPTKTENPVWIQHLCQILINHHDKKAGSHTHTMAEPQVEQLRKGASGNLVTPTVIFFFITLVQKRHLLCSDEPAVRWSDEERDASTFIELPSGNQFVSTGDRHIAAKRICNAETFYKTYV